jgi:hypothetical protein
VRLLERLSIELLWQLKSPARAMCRQGMTYERDVCGAHPSALRAQQANALMPVLQTGPAPAGMHVS